VQFENEIDRTEDAMPKPVGGAASPKCKMHADETE
jgi:hypothetical protein